MNTEEMYSENMFYQNNINEKEIVQKTQSDRPLLIAVVFLVVIGLACIFSASAPKCVDAGMNPAHFLIQQFFGVVLGFWGLKFFANFHYKKLKTLTIPFVFVVIVLLVMVKFAGVTVNGAQRWINLGFLSIQPSELAKPAFVLLLAGIFYKNTDILDNNKIVVAYIPMLVMLAFIYVQPNLSMIMLLVATSVVMYLCAGGSYKLILFGASSLIPLLLWKGLRSYQSSRISIWLNPESDPLGAGYNVLQSLVAFASGGLCGLGYGNSKQKLAWLPEAHTDFIYAVIGEEFGFFGCLLIIGLFWTVLQRGFMIAVKCNDMYGKLIAMGLTFSLCFQGFLNMWVASSFVPATGVPMPFISYGGTSITISLCMVGILLNISKDNIKNMRKYTSAGKV